MKCNDFKAVWQLWSDGELSPELSEKASAHVGSCDRCRAWDLRMKTLEEALMDFGGEEIDPPPFLAARIMARIEHAGPTFLSRLASVFLPRRLAVAGLVAVAFASGMFTTEALRLQKSSTPEVAQNIRIECELPGAEKVDLVGDFNNWGKKEITIGQRRADDRWTFELQLAPGRYQYAFEVNGKKWLPDPCAKGIIPDGFGGINSVLYIPAAAGLEIN